jgi:hypothetical protein
MVTWKEREMETERDELMTLPADMVAAILTGRLGYEVTVEDVERHRMELRSERHTK